MVGLSRFELLTPRLSSVCSNQLSYRPSEPTFSAPLFKEPARLRACGATAWPVPSKLNRTCAHFAVDSLRPGLSPGLMVYQIDLSIGLQASDFRLQQESCCSLQPDGLQPVL